ncbi:MAG: LacI family DNA-binding transcriptional regulator [Pseudomonadota bacterium]
MPVTLKDVALRAGVSRSAVSRTFTAGASVSDQTRRKVERAATELGYRPNALASSLTTGRTKLIGLISNNFRNPFFLEVFDLFTRRLQEQGLRPLLVNLSGETDPTNSVALLRQYSVDGVIVASSTLDPAFAKAFRDAGMPVVHSFGRPDGAARVDVVGVDNVACGRIAARTLLDRGYRKLGFLGGPRSATSTEDRLAGFCEVLTSQGLSPSISFADTYSFEAGRRTMAAALHQDREEAYFCGDDILSIGAMAAVEAAGLSVPGDLGLIGFNDMEMAGWQNIDLTTFHQPVSRIIESSIDLVTGLARDDLRVPETRLFECHIVERGTLRPKPDL